MTGLKWCLINIFSILKTNRGIFILNQSRLFHHCLYFICMWLCKADITLNQMSVKCEMIIGVIVNVLYLVICTQLSLQKNSLWWFYIYTLASILVLKWPFLNFPGRIHPIKHIYWPGIIPLKFLQLLSMKYHFITWERRSNRRK